MRVLTAAALPLLLLSIPDLARAGRTIPAPVALDGPGEVRLTFAIAEATPEYVVVLWLGAGAGSIDGEIERRSETVDWATVGKPTDRSANELRFLDRDVRPGLRYAYRLVWSFGGLELRTSEEWVEVPRPPGFELRGFVPNPAVGAPRVGFSLPDASPARLELLDVAGRRVRSLEVGGLGAGRHTASLGGGPLAPGIYHVRLVGRAGTRRARGVILD